jgi:hypothetical protein
MSDTIVTASGYTVSGSLFVADIDNNIVSDISDYLVSGSIDMNLDRAVKLAATFTLRDPSVVRPYTDFLAPYLRKVFDDGREDEYQQCGLFATKVAPGLYSARDKNATYECADLTSVLANAFYPNGTSNSAATNYATALRTICSNGGISRTNIPNTTTTLPTAQSFGRGTSRLEKANTYLSQLGWYHLGMDLDGRISTPGAPQNLASIEPWRTLTNADIVGTIDVQPTGNEIANVVLAINDDPAAAPLKAIATNSDPQSPTSTVSIGRSIMRLVKVTGATTQGALDALAARILAESRTYYRTAKLTILHDPTALIMHQVVRLDLTGEWSVLNGKWWVRTASLGLTPDKPTVLEINQVSDDLTQAVI